MIDLNLKINEISNKLLSNKNLDTNELLEVLFDSYTGDTKEFYDNLSIYFYKLKNYKKSYEYSLKAYTYIWDQDNYERLRANQAFCIQKIQNDYDYYDINLVNELFNYFKDINDKPITITMTTCKRFDVFYRTVCSFINCCSDITKFVKEWIVVDDNSSETDKKLMVEKFPFIKFIFKDISQKGHPQSMNIILQNISTDYIFHLEDDWLFFKIDNYLTKCLNAFDYNNNVGQCLLNLNYAENLNCYNIKGGEVILNNSNRYFKHTYYKNQELQDFINAGNVKQCCYWPHFSLRVGLSKTCILKDVGSFNNTAKHFEMEYAYRYTDKNYITLFLDNLNCIHIGRNTWERDGHKLNAYDLNNESQFGFEPKNTNDKFEILHLNLKSTPTRKKSIDLTTLLENPVVNPINYNIAGCVINLQRRIDRKLKFIEDNHNKLIDIKYMFFNATDGTTLTNNHKLYKLFEHNDYNFRKGIVGCALSHFKLWIDLLNDDKSNVYLILEDDITLADDFQNKLNHTLINLPVKNNEIDWDICFLGHFLYPQYKTNNDRNNNLPTIKEWDLNTCKKYSMGGTIGYLISKRGAKNLIDNINNNSIYNGIDWVMWKSARHNLNIEPLNFQNKIFYTYPHLIYSECVTNDIKPDSDIQYDYDKSLEWTENDMLNNELNYWCEYFEYDNKIINFLNILPINNFINNNNSKINYSINKISNELELLTKINFIKFNDIELKNKVINLINKLPINYYTFNNHIVTIPDSKITTKVSTDLVLQNNHINFNKIL